MIRLYPNWEDTSTRKDVSQDIRPVSPERSLSSSPVHVRAIDFDAQDTADVIKRAIADQTSPEEALLAYV